LTAACSKGKTQMLKTFIEKLKTDKVYQFGLILFVGVLSLKIMVDMSAKKHAAALKSEQLRVAVPSASVAAPTSEKGYSVTATRPARGTAAGIALQQRKAATTRAVASSRESWTLNQAPRAAPRQEVWRQTSGYAQLPGKGTPVSSYAGQRQISGGSYKELNGQEMAALERELASPARKAIVQPKKKIVRR
jgi:hypothetical protein